MSIRFKWLHDLNIDLGIPEGALSRVFENLDAVSLKLGQIAGDREQIALYTQTVLSQAGTELQLAQREIERLSSFPGNRLRSQLFESLIDSAWNTLIRETQVYYNDLWRSEVYSEYQPSCRVNTLLAQIVEMMSPRMIWLSSCIQQKGR